jgi:hypothetical protein
MGTAKELLDDAMKAIKAAIEDYATTCAIKPVWWTKEGGGSLRPSPMPLVTGK